MARTRTPKSRLRIRAVRKERGMSQEKLAEKVGASRPNVVAWEKGRSFPLVDRLPLIARALDCTIDELFELDSDEEGGES